ncbi:hypothetical protein GTW64_00585 [Streptomyces sp. SID4923]|nr:hypothetical protein [Streptomyces sp. SID4923]
MPEPVAYVSAGSAAQWSIEPTHQIDQAGRLGCGTFEAAARVCAAHAVLARLRPRYVSVAAWQLGHRMRRFAGRLSHQLPLT